MSHTTVWCWRLSIIVRDEYADEDDPVVEIIPIDKYTDDIIDDLYAHNNWLYDEHCWYIADTDLVELPRKDIHNPRWLGFKQIYDDGRYLSIDFWDWEKGNQREKKKSEPIIHPDPIPSAEYVRMKKIQNFTDEEMKAHFQRPCSPCDAYRWKDIIDKTIAARMDILNEYEPCGTCICCDYKNMTAEQRTAIIPP